MGDRPSIWAVRIFCAVAAQGGRLGCQSFLCRSGAGAVLSSRGVQGGALAPSLFPDPPGSAPYVLRMARPDFRRGHDWDFNPFTCSASGNLGDGSEAIICAGFGCHHILKGVRGLPEGVSGRGVSCLSVPTQLSCLT